MHARHCLQHKLFFAHHPYALHIIPVPCICSLCAAHQPCAHHPDGLHIIPMDCTSFLSAAHRDSLEALRCDALQPWWWTHMRCDACMVHTHAM